MHIAIYETNLLWSVKLANGIRALGHTCQVMDAAKLPHERADLALMNLGVAEFFKDDLIRSLKSNGTYIVGHAGHKEKDLMELGKSHGIDRFVSNGTLVSRLEEILTVPQQ